MKLVLLCTTIMLAMNWVVAMSKDEDCDPVTDNVSLQLELAFDQFEDIVPEAPENIIRVIFPTAEANLGNEISPVRTVLPPLYEFDEADPKAYYTLLTMDVDVPSTASPVLAPYLNSLCVNILGSEFNLTNGDYIAPWVGPTPAACSGSHRIVTLLYEQPKRVKVDRDLINFGVNRYRFDLEALVCDLYLKDPVAGNTWTTTADKCCEVDDCCSKCPYSKNKQ